MTREIPLTRGKIAIIDDEDYPLVSKYKWHAWHYQKGNSPWYAIHSVNHKVQIKMHRLILGLKKGEFCDHINGDGLDNHRCNLRIVTHHQNMMNQKKPSGGTSKYKGVHRRKDVNRWASSINFNGKCYYLGHFIDEVEAAKAYDKKAKELFGEYAKLNFKE